MKGRWQCVLQEAEPESSTQGATYPLYTRSYTLNVFPTHPSILPLHILYVLLLYPYMLPYTSL